MKPQPSPYEALAKMDTDNVVVRIGKLDVVTKPDGTEHVVATLSDGKHALAHVVKPE